MGSNITSTVAFKSNLQPVKGSIREDKEFLSAIHDPFALTILNSHGYGAITPIQQKEFRNASLHCSYAYKDDYPWGTIVDTNGQQKVVCKCTNTECRLFSQCRPVFDSEELEAAEQNVRFQGKAQEILDSIKQEPAKTQQKDTGNGAALLTLLGGNPAKDKKPNEAVPPAVVTEPVPGPNKNPDSSPVEPSAITFDSFVEVEQTDIIQLNPEERTVVNAGPGTGKTWTLIGKIKYMLTDEDIPPENILILCFSRAAVEVVRGRLEQAAERDELPLNWHEVDVRTFDSFATYLLAWLQENKPDVLPQGFSLEYANYDQRIRAAVSAITRFTDVLAEYQHVIVDEVQDLVGIRAEMVLALLGNLPETCGFTILGDSCQSLYDYLTVNDSTVMGSDEFYRSIFRDYPFANYYALTHNYRQGDEFGSIANPYREAILTGASQDRTNEAKILTDKIGTSAVNLKHFAASDEVKFRKTGTLGILTRTNGQALQISSWLRAEGINHELQKPLNSHNLASWIGKVLMSAETDVIDASEFSAIFSSVYSEKAAAANQYWNALVSTQRDQTKRHYEIEDILRGLIQNARTPLLFEEPVNDSSMITVSNIHRAKGREFDSVLVLEDVLEAMINEDTDDVLEHKVCYVAVTRPKKRIEKASIGTQYIYISKDEARRCFKSGGRPGHYYLSHFEVGDDSDVNMRSFAENENVQTYIQKLPLESGLRFIRCPEGTKSYVLYKIVPEENERMILGYTTPAFARDIEKAIQRIYKNNHSVAYSYYPEIFSDVYLNGLCTCISASGTGIEGAKKIGDMYLWYGLDISGFARRETTRY